VDAALTLGEAAQILQPPLSERQLRHIIQGLGWQPCGWRRQPHGHPYATYPAVELAKLHAALLPFLRLDPLLCA
jgi:hypothetical protein